MSGQIEGLEWHARHAPGARERPLLRDPARIVTMAGAAMMFVGCLLPWAAGIDGRGVAVAFGANDGSADGIFLVVAAVIIMVMTVTRAAGESPSRSLQIIPFVAAAIGAVVWLTGERSSRLFIAAWTNGGGSGAQTWALWISVIGIVVAALGSLWIYATRSAQVRAQTKGITQEWELTRLGVVEAIGGMSGAVMGGGAGLLTGVLVAGYIGILVMVLLTAFGVMFGMQAGMWVVRSVARRIASY